ncbi:deleted in malignant brain tumors 1 protein-like [Saccostrea cucullata]|uniref:deleted in malignant brain tumors 1 protein-like n=1 Tax=Saccostrea cuccullata TaxID=36930 RepID=UPI002ED2DF69
MDILNSVNKFASQMDIHKILCITLMAMSVNGQSVLDKSSLREKCPLVNLEEMELLINSAAQKVIMSYFKDTDSRFNQNRREMDDLKNMLQKNTMEIQLLKGKIKNQEVLIKNLQNNMEAQAVKQGARLVNGSSFREGRVEVYKDGVWGTVCDDSWDYSDANVICRQLFGLVGSPYSYARFGQGVGIIQMDDVNCNGFEGSLLRCTHKNHLHHNCGHSEDAGVVCMRAPPIRLSRQLEFQGRVEVYKNNEWGTVCDDVWDNKDAGVICRSLGYSEHGLAVSDAVFGQGTGSILFDDVQCNGGETGLSECTFSSTHNCHHPEDAGVICRLEGDYIRLSNGTSVNEGILEVLINGKWGAVCDSNWNQNDAKVACRSLGYYGGGFPVEANVFEEGNEQIWLSGMNCDGNENSLVECSPLVVSTRRCSDRNVGVVCYHNLNEILKFQVDSYISHDIEVIPSIYINNNWMGFCRDGWDDSAAKVVCRSLGYSGYAGLVENGRAERLHRKVLMNVECTANEETLTQCKIGTNDFEQCNNTTPVGVKCYANDEKFIRLVNGTSRSEGRVEVFINGEWGTICYHYWSDANAKVVCKSLGYSGISTSHHRAYFGAESGRVWLDRVQCQGTESSIFDCRHSGYGKVVHCLYNHYAGVTCS